MNLQNRQLRNTSLVMMAISTITLLSSFAMDAVLVRYVLVASGVVLGVVSYSLWMIYVKRENAKVEK